jgi:hypothetical protein
MTMERPEETNRPQLESETEWARARAALGPWGRFRLEVGGWLGSSAVAYYGDGLRCWHGGHTPAQRAWLAAIPVVTRTGLLPIAARFGDPL